MDSSVRRKRNRINIARVTARLIKLVMDLPTDEKLAILDELEERRIHGRRQKPRRPCFMDVDYASDGRAFRGFIKNLSAGGVFIETSETFSIGDEIVLTFSLPETQDPIKIAGEIVRALPGGIGVQFKHTLSEL